MPHQPRAATSIAAPLDVVWAVMLDTDRYAEWNSFVVEARTTPDPQPGDPIELTVEFRPGGRRTVSPERISVVEPPTTGQDGGATRRARLAYEYVGWPARLGRVRGTRWQVLTQRPGEPTSYETCEEFRGPLVALAGPARVEAGFRRHAEDLRERAESLGPRA